MADNKVQIVIEIDAAKGTANIRNLQESFGSLQGRAAALAKEYGSLTAQTQRSGEATRQVQPATQKAAEGVDRLKSSMGAAAAAAGALAAAWGAWKIGDYLKDAALLNARIETLGVVLQTVGRNAWYSGTELTGYVEAVKKMGITTVEAHQTVVSMIQANLDLADASKLARVAQDAAVIGNTNSSESLKGLLHGITTLQPEILRTYGIIVSFETEYAKYAATVGRATDSLSGAEKQQIAMNAVLKAGERISGTYEAAMGTAGKQITSFARYTEELKEAIGAAFGPATSTLVESATQSIKSFRTQAENPATQTSLRELADLTGRFAVAAGENLPTALSAASLVLRTFATGLTVSYGILEVVGKSIGNTLAGLAQMAEGNFRQGWDTWMQDDADALAAMERIADRVNRIWADAAVSVKKAAAATGDEAKVLAQWDADLRRVIRKSALQAEETQRQDNEALKRRMEEDKAALKKWEAERDLIGQTATEKELTQLQRQYDAYSRVVQDKVALERWWADEKAAIDARVTNETIALYEELYRNTGHQDYANAAIEAMKKVLDSQERTWAAILGSEQDARLLRLKREDDYAAKVKALLGDIVDATVEAEQARTEAVASGVRERIEEEKQALSAAAAPAAKGVGEYTGLPVGVFSFHDSYAATLRANSEQILEMNYAASKRLEDEAEKRLQNEQRIKEAVDRATDSMARMIAAEQGHIDKLKAIDYAALSDLGKASNIGGVMGSLYGAMNTIGLGTQSAAVQLNLYRDLFFGSMTSLSALDVDETLSYLVSLVQLTADAHAEEIRARKDLLAILEREEDFRARMLLSNLSPVQSAESFTARYESLLAVAGNSSADYEAFTSFLEQEYLPYMKAYTGGQQSYREIWDSLFGAGGVLDALSATVAGDASVSLEDIQSDALGELQSIVGLLGPGGSLYGVLSGFARDQTSYASTYLKAMAEQIGLQTDPIEQTEGYTKSTAYNTTLLENLIKFIGATEAYQIGGVYYNARQIEALSDEATAYGGYFRIGEGYYDSLASLNTPRVTVQPADTGGGQFELPEIESPPLETYYPGVQLGSAYYRAAYLQNQLSNAVAGKINIGGTAYTVDQLSSMIAGAQMMPGSTQWSTGGVSPYQPVAPSFTKLWADALSVYAYARNVDTWQYTAGSVHLPELTYAAGDASNLTLTYDTPAWLQPGRTNAALEPYQGNTYNVRATLSYYLPGVGNQSITETGAFTVLPGMGYGSSAMNGQRTPPSPLYIALGAGGLTSGLSIAGERGPEWVVPTYEPERSRFLASVPSEFWRDVLPSAPATRSLAAPSIDPEAIGRAVARAILAAGIEGDREIHIHLEVDGREISRVVADGFRRGDADLVTQARRRMAS